MTIHESPIRRRLLSARLSSGFSQKKLGELADLDLSTASARMNQYETGRHTPSFHTLKRLGEILGVPTEYFYTENDEIAEILIFLFRSSFEQRVEFLSQLKNKVCSESDEANGASL